MEKLAYKSSFPSPTFAVDVLTLLIRDIVRATETNRVAPEKFSRLTAIVRFRRWQVQSTDVKNRCQNSEWT
jgi:uncharacterized protein YcbK (DUF882 family)